MEVLLNKYEYAIMKCASHRNEEFNIENMQRMLMDVGITRLGEESVRFFLNQLVKKKMVKRRSSWMKFFKRISIYQTCYSEEYFLEHTRNLDLSMELDRKVWAEEIKRKQKENMWLSYSPSVISEGYFTLDEVEEIHKKSINLNNSK